MDSGDRIRSKQTAGEIVGGKDGIDVMIGDKRETQPLPLPVKMHLHRRILLSTGSNGPRLSSPPPPAPSRQVPSHVIIAVASTGAAALFLALVYYAVLRHRHRRPSPYPSISAPRDAAAASNSDDHPFWHVETIGLEDSAIVSIGSYAHIHGDHNTADNNCSVCLGEVLDGEIVRLLPKCGHVFHVQCIDTWLRCHISCPLCRADVGVAAAPADHAADFDGASSVEGSQSGEEDVVARVSVESLPDVPESSEEATASAGALRSVSLDSVVMGRIGIRADEEKEGNFSNSANCSKDEGSDKGQSESGRGFLFSRLGRARSSSVLPL